MNIKRYPSVLTIAGSDSGGGAGIQADIKTISALGAYGSSVITALTAQNTLGVRAIHAVPPAFIKDQLDAVFEDIIIDAVKIGMINRTEVALVIADALDRFKPEFVVFDPVMVSTSGAKLIEDEAIAVLWKQLFPKADLVTPNLEEAEILVGRKISSVDEMKTAAEDMVRKGCRAVLLKGGHLAGPVIFDVLATKHEETLIMETKHIESLNVHGTGCTLSAAIATFMARGNSLVQSIHFAKKYVSGAIEAGRFFKTGNGSGPLNHAFLPTKMKTKS